MIDYKALQLAYDSDRFYALQLEIGDQCHQGCIYCYMNALEDPQNTLTDHQIRNIISESILLNISAIEWLGGEPLLRESVFDHMALANKLGMRNNMWTGGLPLTDSYIRKKTNQLTRFGLISFHISTIDPALYKILHPDRPEKDLDNIILGIEKLLEEGYPSKQMLNSITFTGLQTAEDTIRTIDRFEKEYGIKTSLNVYHTYLRPGTPDSELQRFIPDDQSVRKVYKRISEQWGVKRFPMNCVNKQYCSATLAILCDGSITPCATIRLKDAPNIHQGKTFGKLVEENLDWLILKPFKEIKNLPEDCQLCNLSDQCFGCRSRAFAADLGIYGKDPRCFIKVRRQKHGAVRKT